MDLTPEQRALIAEVRSRDYMRDVAPLTAGSISFREEGDKLLFGGHAAVFDQLSLDLGGFREKIQRGAFKDVLEANANGSEDTKFLSLNHNPDTVDARFGNGTLELRENPKGLAFDTELAPTSTAKDLRVRVDLGVIHQMSFGFRVGKDHWEPDPDDEFMLIRTVIRFKRLYDISPVTYPAYPQTDVLSRSLVLGTRLVDDDGETRLPEVRALAWKVHNGELEATDEDRAAIDRAFSKTDTVSPWTAERALRAAAQEPELLAAVRGQRATVILETAPSGGPDPDFRARAAARRRRLELAELES